MRNTSRNKRPQVERDIQRQLWKGTSVCQEVTVNLPQYRIQTNVPGRDPKLLLVHHRFLKTSRFKRSFRLNDLAAQAIKGSSMKHQVDMSTYLPSFRLR